MFWLDVPPAKRVATTFYFYGMASCRVFVVAKQYPLLSLDITMILPFTHSPHTLHIEKDPLPRLEERGQKKLELFGYLGNKKHGHMIDCKWLHVVGKLRNTKLTHFAFKNATSGLVAIRKISSSLSKLLKTTYSTRVYVCSAAMRSKPVMSKRECRDVWKFYTLITTTNLATQLAWCFWWGRLPPIHFSKEFPSRTLFKKKNQCIHM